MVAAVMTSKKLSTGGCASRARAPFSIEKGLTGRVGSGKPNRRRDSRYESRRDEQRGAPRICGKTGKSCASLGPRVIHRSSAQRSGAGRVATVPCDLDVTLAVSHSVTGRGAA